ncbi:MAG: excinuclease ABC subunit UvrB [Chloroflexota bacterium]
MPEFEIVSDYKPSGDQPEAIKDLAHGLNEGHQQQILLGATGTGKTFTIANVIQEVQRPTLVMAHNKTLAAQLYREFRSFFPNNAVEYFVSYYDYYQPEAYIPRTDTFIEKDAQINDEINRLRLSATEALFTRRDVIIVASVSAIYGLGDPSEYGKANIEFNVGEIRKRDRVLRHLVDIHYDRNDYDLKRGTFRVRGDTLEIRPAYNDLAYRIEFFGDDIDRITEIDALTGEVVQRLDSVAVFPARHFITPQDKLRQALIDIEAELDEQLKKFKEEDKLIEAQRIEQRTRYDLEMLREIGFCSGIENYSRPLSLRPEGSTPWTLIDYFPDDYLMVVDESHMSLPQIRGMYNGDRARKLTLVDFGFRLPSALDNRPLQFEEWEDRVHQIIYTSATPGPYELDHTEQTVEQIIRPTGLVDPEVIIRPSEGQIDDLLNETRRRIDKGQRVLVTTLTKRMSEDLADFMMEAGLKVQYLHSDIQTLERVEILRDLRMGVFDVVVGINLLREGLDLPEVSLVAILDADKEGFLRSDTALIQTIGRAARHVDGTVLMYADNITGSMQRAIDETNRRRKKQIDYNEQHGIEPQSILKEIRELVNPSEEEDAAMPEPAMMAESGVKYQTNADKSEAVSPDQLTKAIEELEKQMKAAAAELEFEKAAMLRDQVRALQMQLDLLDERPEWEKLQS